MISTAQKESFSNAIVEYKNKLGLQNWVLDVHCAPVATVREHSAMADNDVLAITLVQKGFQHARIYMLEDSTWEWLESRGVSAAYIAIHELLHLVFIEGGLGEIDGELVENTLDRLARIIGGINGEESDSCCGDIRPGDERPSG